MCLFVSLGHEVSQRSIILGVNVCGLTITGHETQSPYRGEHFMLITLLISVSVQSYTRRTIYDIASRMNGGSDCGNGIKNCPFMHGPRSATKHIRACTLLEPLYG